MEKLKPEQKNRLRINIIANAGTSPLGTSGGDQIFIECARRWANDGHGVHIYTWKEGYEVCKKNKLEGVHYKVFKSDYKKFGFPFLYLARTIKVCIEAFRTRPDSNSENTIIYSSSDFLPDSLPAFMMKKRFTYLKWVAGFYLFAPNPLKSSTDINYRGGYRTPNLRSILYYLSQRFVYWLIKKYADFILVSNQLDTDIFVKDGINPERVKPIYGGVNIQEIANVPQQEIRYDGCFVGRLHFQKGPLELVEIWHLVCREKKNARLALIGNGPLEEKIKEEISKRGLKNNIDILGYIGGERKIKILKSSKIFLHTPVLDTGGMAAAEGMACGLPVIGFDLPGYKYCFPLGMLKVPIGDLKTFSELVLKLLKDKTLYRKTSTEALEFSQEWDWNEKAKDILNTIENVCFLNG